MSKNRAFAFNHYFTNFALFNLVFLVLQFAYMFSQSGSFIKAIPLPLDVYLELARALIIQLLLYVILTLVQTALLWGIERHSSEKITLERWQLIIYILSISSIVALNCYFFPLSEFSRLFLPPVPQILIKIIFSLSLFVLSFLALNTLWRAYRSLPLYISCFFMVGLIVLSLFFHEKLNVRHNQTAQPNIIMIGVDSLSPERVTAQNAPNLHEFAQQSVQFQETISPLARTYAAWTSILTGLYPLHHHARYNLMPSDEVKSSASLAWTLQKMGYHTLFGTDDRRFSSIGTDFGFQDIVGPKLGVNDVLLGSFYDFPLSNLLINLRLSRWLFPYNYLNRAGHFSYYPSSFDQALQGAIGNINNKNPLFMAVHFTLPHWPYAWAESSPAQVKDEYSVEERGQLYLDAIHRADQQVGTLLQKLQQAGFLENSLLIVLSDHGEVLYERGSRRTDPKLYQGKDKNFLADYFKRKTSTVLEKSAGHGSDLLSPSQYHCLLAVKIFKQNRLATTPQVVNSRVALIDIAPTVYAFLNIPLKRDFDGISLLNTIRNKEQLPENRVFMLESGELPNMIVSKEKARILGKLLFTINPSNDQLEIRRDRLAFLGALKLYGILDGNWLVALYPDDNRYITVTLHLSDGKWVDELDSSFAQSSPANSMLKQLLQFYSKELSSYPKLNVAK